MGSRYKLAAGALGAVLLLTACSGSPSSASSSAPSSGGGSSAAPSPSSSASQAAPKETVEITQWVWDRGTIPADQGTLEDNWWTKYIDEHMAPLGIKVSYIITPRAQEAEMLSTMLAAGTAPDVLHTNQQALINTYINGGGVADLTSAVETYGQNLKKLYDDETLKWGMKDGKIYGVYHLNNGFLASTWIRKDMLDQLGLDIPTNPTEYHDMLLAAKAKFGDSIAPFAFQGNKFGNASDIILPAFFKEDITPIDLWKPVLLVDGMKECLQYLNTLYNEGLIRDFILDSDESLFKAAISRGELFSFCAFGHYPYHSAYGNLYDNLRQNQPEAELIATFPWKNEALGKNYYTETRSSNPMANYFVCVPASSKHVEQAVQYIDWMASDDAYLPSVLGFEGVDYAWENDMPKMIDVDHYNATIAWIEPQYGTLGKAFTTDPEKFKADYMKNFNPDYFDAIKKDSKVFQDIPVMCPTITATTEVYDEKRPTLTDIANTAIPQLIMCKAEEFDKLWDSFQSEYKAAGAEEAWADLQAAWTAMGN